MRAAGPVEFNYKPRDQFLRLHQRNERFACVVAHRRCGKTVACVNDEVLRGIYTPKHNARYAYVAPYYRQAKDVAWVYLKEATRDFAIKIRESELRIELPNSAWITLYGADNPDALRGIYLDGVILDEYGDCRPSLWPEVVLPTLADRHGWAVFIGTAKGKNHFYDTVQRAKTEDSWLYMELPASKTGILGAEELAELRYQMTDAQYAREIECDFDAAVEGTYYAQIIQELEQKGQIAPDIAVYDPDYPVHLVADLGFTDSTALWFWQLTPDGCHMVDYYENQSQPLEHYTDHIRATGYDIEKFWLPHDAKQKTLQTGRGTVEQLIDEGFPCVLVPNLKKQQGIDAARLILPKIRINQQKCHKGIEALRAYRRKFNEITKVYSDTPLHDWSSDGADSFRYFALVTQLEIVVPNDPAFDTSPLAASSYTLDGLYAEKEQHKKYTFEKMRI